MVFFATSKFEADCEELGLTEQTMIAVKVYMSKMMVGLSQKDVLCDQPQKAHQSTFLLG